MEGSQRHPPLCARRPDHRVRRAHLVARGDALRDHRLPGHVAAAQLGRLRRVRRPPRHPCLPGFSGRVGAQRLPHPRLGARHQPRERGDVRDAHRADRLRRRRQHRRRRPQSQGGQARGQAVGAHGDVPVDPRRLRGDHRRDLRHDPRQRRAGLHGRRQHERAGRPVRPRLLRRRRLPPQPAQDLLHPARRRRAGHRPDWRGRAPQAVHPVAPGGADGRRRGFRHRRGRAVGLGVHPAHLVDVLRDDGRRRPAARDGDRHPQRQLHGRAARGPLQGAVHGQGGLLRTRVHPRPAGIQGECGRDRGRHCQAARRLQLPRAHHVVAGGGHHHGRAHRVGGQGGARPLLRRSHRDSRRDRPDRAGRDAARRQSAQERAAHRRRRARRRVGSPIHAHRRRLPGGQPAAGQVLADDLARQRHVWRPQPRVLVPAARGLR
mmetsp:Transcript_33392/g.78104  ORF Transcript_33392/g.78104 Transcript_33392/m.78104 type:complete len:434 (+) Transcript_33392:768-2069(+)